jgi:hypothetical protein
MLRITPQPSAGRIWCAPAIPGPYLPLRVTGLRLGQAHLTIDIHGDDWDLTGLDGTGIELVREPRTYHSAVM